MVRGASLRVMFHILFMFMLSRISHMLLNLQFLPLVPMVKIFALPDHPYVEFAEDCLLILKGLCGTLKRVVWYFEEGGVVL